VFVCDSFNDRVQVFKRDGSFVREWGSAGSEKGYFNGCNTLAVHCEEVFVCDGGNRRVQVFTREGVFVRQWGSFGEAPGQFLNPTGLVVRGEEVIVGDFDRNQLQVFEVDGSLVQIVNIPKEHPRTGASQWLYGEDEVFSCQIPRYMCVVGREIFLSSKSGVITFV
jgi:hypothetical protein